MANAYSKEISPVFLHFSEFITFGACRFTLSVISHVMSIFVSNREALHRCK
jgi:hypothetical protein